MKAFQVLSRIAYGITDIVFLDIHMVCIKQNADVRTVNHITVVHSLFCRVDKAGFKPVYRLNAVRNTAFLGNFHNLDYNMVYMNVRDNLPVRIGAFWKR